MGPKFETTTWQLLACVLTQLAIDLVAAERKTREVWLESQTDPSFPHFSLLRYHRAWFYSLKAWNRLPFEYQFGILVTLFPPPPPWKKRNQERVKSWPISWSTFCQTGLVRVLKTWKVLQFYFDIFQNQKVLEEKDYRSWKNKSEPGKILEICFWKGVRTLLDRLIFFGFFFSVFFPSLYKFKKCLVHKRVKKN